MDHYHPPQRRLGSLMLSLGAMLAFTAVAPAQEVPLKKSEQRDQFFQQGTIPRLKIEIEPADVETIKKGERPYVPAAFIENDELKYRNIGVKLKGAAGSFRGFDDRPALTVNFDKFKKKLAFHGLDKFHLNNSVQDNSLLNEWLCAEIFQAAGVPASRVTHARVWLNGRDLGLYVLKEGFDDGFLKRHFDKTSGNLYDGGFVRDFDAGLEKDGGKGPDDRSDLAAVVAAVREPDPAKRLARVSELVDLEAFITFMVLERMTCHWDGYCQNVNNYRIYFDLDQGEPGRGKAVFFPHGMDQMFGDVAMNMFDGGRGMLSQFVMQNPELAKRYRDRVRELVVIISPPDRWLTRLDEVGARLQPVLKEINEGAANEHANRIRELKERLVARAKNIHEQLARLPPEPVPFNEHGVMPLVDWQPKSESQDAKLELVELGEGKKGLSIQVGPSGQCVASWRKNVLLGPGTYRFVATCRVQDVVPLDDNDSSAAGLRISGSQRSARLQGTGSGPVVYEFSVNEDRREVMLVAELRARQGQAIFAADTLRLEKVKPQ